MRVRVKNMFSGWANRVGVAEAVSHDAFWVPVVFGPYRCLIARNDLEYLS